MSRLISDQSMQSLGSVQLNALPEQTAQQRAEDYLERVAKLVPVEIIAAYLAIRGLIPQPGSPDAFPPVIEFIVFGTLVVLTPIYFAMLGGNVPRKKLQVMLATFSFLIWSYGIGGPFFYKSLANALQVRIEYPGLGSIIVILWSLVIGLVKPKP